MKHLLIGATAILVLMVIIAVILTVPQQKTITQTVFLIFLSSLIGIASIAEIVGLINHFRRTKPHEIVITRGNYSPGKVGKDYSVNRNKKDQAQRIQTKASTSRNSNIDTSLKEGNVINTEGDYSPGKVEGNYEVNDE